MPTKEQLRAATLAERDMVRVQDPTTKQFSIVANTVDKTALMLYTEGVTGRRIEDILLMQMSPAKIAEYITSATGKLITRQTVYNWRKQFKITRRRR